MQELRATSAQHNAHELPTLTVTRTRAETQIQLLNHQLHMGSTEFVDWPRSSIGPLHSLSRGDFIVLVGTRTRLGAATMVACLWRRGVLLPAPGRCQTKRCQAHPSTTSNPNAPVFPDPSEPSPIHVRSKVVVIFQGV